VGAPESGESEVSREWDEFPAGQRIDVLRRELESALVAMERGDMDPSHLRTAEASLSASRVELFGSERGQAAHAAYEDRLDRATQDKPRRPPIADTPGAEESR
jgi:hypothetical protein